MDMNIVLLQGKLAADPTVKIYKKDDKEEKLAQICIVNQSRFTNSQNQNSNEKPRPEPLYMYATAFGPIAKYIEKSFKKGSRILIYGEILPNTYEKNGKTIHSQQLIIRRAYFDGLNRGKQNTGNEPPADNIDTADTLPPPDFPVNDEFMTVSQEELKELPFADI